MNKKEINKMVTMQAFYTDLFSQDESALSGLVRIAQASLEDILAVRSELAWDVWGES
jgi:hypothetical protein